MLMVIHIINVWVQSHWLMQNGSRGDNRGKCQHQSHRRLPLPRYFLRRFHCPSLPIPKTSIFLINRLHFWTMHFSTFGKLQKTRQVYLVNDEGEQFYWTKFWHSWCVWYHTSIPLWSAPFRTTFMSARMLSLYEWEISRFDVQVSSRHNTSPSSVGRRNFQ